MNDPVWYNCYEEGVPKRIEIENISLYEMFERSAKNFGQRPAIVFGGKTWTYTDMERDVDRLAKALIRLGVKPKDRISINMPNSATWMISFFAIMKVGAIVVQTTHSMSKAS